MSNYIPVAHTDLLPLSEDINAIFGVTGAGTLAANSIGASADSDILNRVAADGRYPLRSQIGAANGIAGLDDAGKVPLAQLPDSAVGGMTYRGTWDATDNVPALVSGVGAKGSFYKVARAGGTVINGNGDWHVGDWIAFDGLAWDKIDNYEAVTSVAGKTGAVTLAQADIAGLTTGSTPAFAGLTVDSLSGVVKAASGALSAGATTSDLPEGSNLYYTDGRAAAAAPVQSVAGKTGVVTLAQADIAGLTTSSAPAFAGLTVDSLSGVVKAASGALSAGATTSDLPEGSNLYYTNARALAAAPVQSVAGKTGVVTLAQADIAGLTTSSTPAFTGLTVGTLSGVVKAAAGAVSAGATVADLPGAAPLASPVFTGNPTAPTPVVGDSSTAVATTAFVKSQGYLTANQAVTLTGAVTGSGTGTITTTLAPMAATTLKGNASGAAGPAADLSASQVMTMLGAAPVASPVFTGAPTAPTPVVGDSSTAVATTAFVKSQGYLTANQAVTLTGAVTGSGTGTITTTLAPMAATTLKGNASGAAGPATDLSVSQVAAMLSPTLSASPTFTGTPTAPTPSPGDSSAAVATTAFVANAINTTANLTTVYDQIALLNLRLLITTSISTGALAQGREWELLTDEWSAGSSGQTLVTGSPGYYTGIAQIAQGTGAAIGTLTGGGGLAAAFDGVTSQAGLASANVYLSGYNNTVGKHWAGPTVIAGFKAWGATDYGFTTGSVGVKLQGSNDGSSWTDLWTGATAGGAGEVLSVMSGLPQTAYTYHRVNFNNPNSGSYSINVAELQFFAPSNVTLIPPAIALTVAPSYADAYFLWKDDCGSAVLGTDITVDLSRDGGTTWTAAILTAITPAAGFDGTYTGVRARASLAGQPSGTALTCRIKTLNAKLQRVAAPALYAE